MKIQISLTKQQLTLSDDDGEIVTQYAISSGEKGIGQKMHSEQTPLGRHQICEKIGGGCAINSVFKGRVFTGEVYTPELGKQHPERDWILTRILRMHGLQPGFNQGGDVDTLDRLIYFHGTAEEDKIGKPASHGCIRLRNKDMLQLFDLVDIGTVVIIEG